MVENYSGRMAQILPDYSGTVGIGMRHDKIEYRKNEGMGLRVFRGDENGRGVKMKRDWKELRRTEIEIKSKYHITD